jgi:hypothetical protein
VNRAAIGIDASDPRDVWRIRRTETGEADAREGDVPRLTRERVVSLVGRGRLDDHAIAEIIRAGATDLELLEAVNRVTRGSSEVGAEKMKPMTRQVAMLCEILAVAGYDTSEPD